MSTVPTGAPQAATKLTIFNNTPLDLVVDASTLWPEAPLKKLATWVYAGPIPPGLQVSLKHPALKARVVNYNISPDKLSIVVHPRDFRVGVGSPVEVEFHNQTRVPVTPFVLGLKGDEGPAGPPIPPGQRAKPNTRFGTTPRGSIYLMRDAATGELVDMFAIDQTNPHTVAVTDNFRPERREELDDPYVIIQTVIDEVKNQDQSYLTISATDDPGRDLYQLTEEELDAGRLPDMASVGKTRVVHISGVKLVWDGNVEASRGMMAYNRGADIAELNLYADTVIIREPLIVPGGDVRIHARRLEFRGRGRIVTDAQFVQQTPVEIGVPGADGARGGTVALLVKTPRGNPESWPAAAPALEYGCGFYFDGLDAAGDTPQDPRQPLISARGAQGQAGGPGGTKRTPLAYTPVAQRSADNLRKLLAEFPLKHKNGGDAGLIGLIASGMENPNWDSGLSNGMGGGSVLELTIAARKQGEDLQDLVHEQGKVEGVTPSPWPPKPGQNATPAGKPGTGGRGGDLKSTDRDIVLGFRRSLEGGSSGAKGTVAVGGDPDKPASYKKQTLFVTVVPRGIRMAILHTRLTEDPVTLGVGNAAAPPAADRPKGEDGQVLSNDHPSSWVHPFQVRAVVQYSKDLFQAGHRDKARALLAAYREVLTPPGGASDWPEDLQVWQDDLASLAREVEALLGRLDSSQDFFGNPVGWAPVLTLKSNVQLYNKEIEHALNELWLAYRVTRAYARVQKEAAALTDASNALDENRVQIEEKLEEAQNEVPGLMQDLRAKVNNRTTQQASLATKIVALKALAADDEERKRTIDAVAGIIGAACTIIPVGQPYLKAGGQVLQSVTGFFTKPPEEHDTVVKSLGTTATKLSKNLGSASTRKAQLRSVTEELDKVKEEQAKLNDEVKTQTEARADLDKKNASAKELREARSKTRAKETAVSETEAEIKLTRMALAAYKRECPKEPTPGQPDPDKAKRDGIKLVMKQLEEDLEEQEGTLSGHQGELTTARTAVAGKAAKLKDLEEKQTWSAGVKEAKAKIEANKKKVLTKQKEVSDKLAFQESTLAGVGEGLGELAKSVKMLTLPREEVQARVDRELAGLKAKDPAYLELKTIVGQLDLEVTDLTNRFQATKAEVESTTQHWQDNRRQARALGEAIRTSAKALDHFALQYVEKMKADARERLTRFQYYIQKSYEYLFLKPCPEVDYRLGEMTDRIVQLLGSLKDDDLKKTDFEDLMPVFRRPILRIADRIVEHMQTQVRGLVATMKVSLSEKLTAALNGSSDTNPVVFNLVDAFDLGLTTINQRLDDVTLDKVVLGAVAGGVPVPRPPSTLPPPRRPAPVAGGPQQKNSLRLHLRHRGPSLVRGRDALYCFTAGRPGGRKQWGFTWDIGEGKAYKDEEQTDSQAILENILGIDPRSSATGHGGLTGQDYFGKLTEYQPGIFSEFEMWVEWSGEGVVQPIKALNFTLRVPYDQPDDQYVLLHFRTSDGLLPRIDCGYWDVEHAMPDGKGLGGYGNFFRLFRKGTRVYVRAPKTYGSRTFQEWQSKVSGSVVKLTEPHEFEFTPHQAQTLTAVYSG